MKDGRKGAEEMRLGARVLLLGGSLARPSHTGALLRAVGAALEGAGAEVERWDLVERPLPVADPAYHRRPGEHPLPVVRELVAAAEGAGGMVLGSPVYHNSYSGALKNALDLLGIRHFEGKPVGLVSNGGGMRSTQAVDHLRLVVRGLRGVAVPTQVVTAEDDYVALGKELGLRGRPIEGRVGRFVREFLWFEDRLGGALEADSPGALGKNGLDREEGG